MTLSIFGVFTVYFQHISPFLDQFPWLLVHCRALVLLFLLITNIIFIGPADHLLFHFFSFFPGLYILWWSAVYPSTTTTIYHPSSIPQPVHHPSLPSSASSSPGTSSSSPSLVYVKVPGLIGLGGSWTQVLVVSGIFWSTPSSSYLLLKTCPSRCVTSFIFLCLQVEASSRLSSRYPFSLSMLDWVWSWYWFYLVCCCRGVRFSLLGGSLCL